MRFLTLPRYIARPLAGLLLAAGAVLAADGSASSQEPFTGSPSDIYLSISAGDTVDGLAIRNEDVVAFDGTSFRMLFDGSDVGLEPFVIDALEMSFQDFQPGGRILLSFTEPGTVPGLGAVDDSDLVRFHPTSLGENTAGTFSLAFDGSDIGLTTDGEDIDAIEFVEFSFMISTTGSFAVTGDFGSTLTGEDEDVLECYDRRGGTDSGCAGFNLAFDGSDVGLTSDGEDVDAFAFRNYNGVDWSFSTTTSFSVPGLSGPNEDVFTCGDMETGSETSCAAFRRLFEGDAYGIAGNVSALELPIQGE
jgi:hypothetical protein